MTKNRALLALAVSAAVLSVSPCACAQEGEGEGEDEQRFCAVSWGGVFTHLVPGVGIVPPTRNDVTLKFQALAYSPSGSLVAAAKEELYEINPGTGEMSLTLAISPDIRGMAFSTDGRLFITSGSGDVSGPQRLRVVDLADGSYTDVGKLWGDNRAAQGLAFSADGTLYGISRDHEDEGSSFRLLTIDIETAEMHLVGGSEGVSLNQSICFTPTGRLYALGETEFARLDPATGQIIGPVTTLDGGSFRGVEWVGALDEREPFTCLGGLLARPGSGCRFPGGDMLLLALACVLVSFAARNPETIRR